MTANEGRDVRNADGSIAGPADAPPDYSRYLLGSLEGMTVFGLDREFRYLYFNKLHADSMLAMYGSEIAVGAHFVACMPTEAERTGATEILDRALAGESQAVVYVFGEAKDVHFESRFGPIMDDEGKIVGVSCYAQDVSARIRAEAALVTAVFDLRAAERRITEQQELAHLRSSFAVQERYRRIVESSYEGIWTIDADARTDFVNKKMAGMLGYTPDEMIGRPLYDFIADEVKPHAALTVRRCEQGIAEHRKFCLQHKSGAAVWTSMTNSPIYDENGVYAGAMALVVEADEHKRGEHVWGHVERQLEQARRFETAGRLAGGIAHYFNNLMDTIGTHVERALGFVDSSHASHAQLVAAQSAAKRSAGVIRELSIIAGTQPHYPEVIDVNDTIGGALDDARATVGIDVDVLWTPEPGIWPVLADPALFVKAGKDLFLHAYGAIEGQGTVIIEVANVSVDGSHCAKSPGAVPGDYVRLTFETSGRGVSQNELLHVFEPFYLTPTDETDAGLRLASVYGSVRRSGGFVEASSVADAGFTFRTYLPRHGEHA